MVNEREYCCQVIEREFKKPLVITKKSKILNILLNAEFAKKRYKVDDFKVKDHFRVIEASRKRNVT